MLQRSHVRFWRPNSLPPSCCVCAVKEPRALCVLQLGVQGKLMVWEHLTGYRALKTYSATKFIYRTLRSILPSPLLGQRVLLCSARHHVCSYLLTSVHPSIHPALLTALQPTISHGSCLYFVQQLTLIRVWTPLTMWSICSYSRILWQFEISPTTNPLRMAYLLFELGKGRVPFPSSGWYLVLCHPVYKGDTKSLKVDKKNMSNFSQYYACRCPSTVRCQDICRHSDVQHWVSYTGFPLVVQRFVNQMIRDETIQHSSGASVNLGWWYVSRYAQGNDDMIQYSSISCYS